jgi:octaprenyl-diphosphate synthase
VGEPEYFDLIYRKTACLFDVSMRLGAILGGASEALEEQMGEYGRNLGIAFQIIDDVLDLTATEEVLGKPVASDLREGKATLAIVHTMEHAGPEELEAIRRVLGDMSFDRTTHQQVLDILERHGSVRYALDCAFQYADVARAALAGLPESDYKRALLWMPDFVVARDK